MSWIYLYYAQIAIFSIALVMVVFAFIFPDVFSSKKLEKKMEEIFGGREPRTKQEFYQKYFQADGLPEYLVVKVIEILEFNLGVDLSRLEKSDDFSENLNFFWRMDSLADVEIILDIEREFSIEITKQEGANTRTVDDLVRLVWSKVNLQIT